MSVCGEVSQAESSTSEEPAENTAQPIPGPQTVLDDSGNFSAASNLKIPQATFYIGDHPPADLETIELADLPPAENEDLPPTSGSSAGVPKGAGFVKRMVDHTNRFLLLNEKGEKTKGEKSKHHHETSL